MNIALILAGGTGTRVGETIPKQYIAVKEKPIISYCLYTFEQNKDIDYIQIVADEVWRDEIKKWVGHKLMGFSEPGVNRQLSIFNGLEDIRKYAEEDAVVIIHDAARPLVSEQLITNCLEAVKQHEGAIPVLPMKDTVYYSENGKTISSLLKRECIYAGQAPESFILGSYYEANRRLLPNQILKVNGSTEPAVMAGMDIALVKGEETNFKITTKSDLKHFIQILEGEKE